jgi:hypothetical protein
MNYAITYTEYELDCAQIENGKTPLPVGSAYPVPANLMEIPGNYLIIDSGVLREKTTEEKTTYDDAKAVAEFPLVKQAKIDAIDDKTDELICSGFTFDGKVFSTDPNAQFNWKNMFDLTNAGIMPLPVVSNTKDNEAYSFIDQDSVNNFYIGGVQHVQGLLNGGRALKYQVLACTTTECVNSIVDPRYE